MKHVPIQFESLLRSRKIPVESFSWSCNLNLHSICLSYGLKLGGHAPRIESPCWGACLLFQAYFVSISSLWKNETGFKHSLSLFQACVKMKPTSSRVFWFQACVKMKPFPFYLLWFPFYQPVFARWALVFSFHHHYLLGRSYAFTWLFYLFLRNRCDELYC